VGSRQHTGDLHFQGINAGDVEQGFRRGNNGITWIQVEFHGHLGSNNTLPIHNEHLTPGKFNSAKIKVIQYGPDNGKTSGMKANIQWNRCRQVTVHDLFGCSHGDGFRYLIAIVERVHHQIKSTALGADQQWARLCPQGKLSFALAQQDFQSQWQGSDNGDTAYKDERLHLIVAQVAPGKIKTIHHTVSVCTKSLKLTTLSKWGSNS